MKERAPLARALLVLVAFFAGMLSHVLYQRWNDQQASVREPLAIGRNEPHQQSAGELQRFRVAFAPLAPVETPVELPVLRALEIDKIRTMAGRTARIRGRIFRVGHSVKSNTYFLNFGPSRAALTAVVFASAVDAFEKAKLPPRAFDGREVEVTGEIRNHPQYGLEVILEDPSQIRILH